jgi:hypothetical protein
MSYPSINPLPRLVMRGINRGWPWKSSQARGERPGCGPDRPSRRLHSLAVAGNSRPGERRGRRRHGSAACPSWRVDAAHDDAAPELGPDISCAAVSHLPSHLHSPGEKLESGTGGHFDRNCGPVGLVGRLKLKDDKRDSLN